MGIFAEGGLGGHFWARLAIVFGSGLVGVFGRLPWRRTFWIGSCAYQRRSVRVDGRPWRCIVVWLSTNIRCDEKNKRRKAVKRM